jgi:dTDP-4-amino-4,6-dideoxygalactose transaminase
MLKFPGYKFNMSDINASLGLEGLKKIDERHRRRDQIWTRYYNELSGLPGLDLPVRPASEIRHARHIFACILDPVQAGLDRNRMIEALNGENIGAGVHFIPVHHYSFYRDKYGYRGDEFPHANRVGLNGFSLPLTPYLSEKDVDDVILAVKKILTYYSQVK